MRGVRIQNVVKELNGEKIDVVEWSPDTSVFIANALSPAKVMNVYLSDNPHEGKTATVIVPDDQLSLAIGKGGQNARLAAKLTGWRIDIKSATEAAEEALQKAKEETIAEAMAVAQKKDILALAEAILMRKETVPPTVTDMQVLKEAIDVVETTAAMQREREGTSIEVLGLSSRAHNVLTKAGFNTIESIMEKLSEGDQALLALKGFGPKMLAELKEKLQAQGFITLEEEAEPEAVVEEAEEVAEPEALEVAPPEAEETVEEEKEVPAAITEEAPAEEIEPTEEEPILDYEEEELLEYEYEYEEEEEEDEELEHRRKKGKKRRLVYDEELGKVVARRRRKPSRHRDEWEEYY